MPLLVHMVSVLLTAPAASTSCERVHSVAGRNVQDALLSDWRLTGQAHDGLPLAAQDCCKRGEGMEGEGNRPEDVDDLPAEVLGFYPWADFLWTQHAICH